MPADRNLSDLSTQRATTPHPAPGPTGAAKVLGAYLRSLRVQQGVRLADVAPQVKVSVAKLSRLERGESAPNVDDVYQLLRHYGVNDRLLRHEVELLIGQTSAHAWWTQYADVTPGWLQRLIALERLATHLFTYEVHVIPGLLQTPRYTAALVRGAMPYVDEIEVTRRVELRQERQRLLGGDHGTKVQALLDESILYRPVGGPEVMAAQLEFLLQRIDEGVSIRIVPFTKAAYFTPPAHVTLLRFAPGGPTEMVYLEQLNSALYLSDTDEVFAYRRMLDELALGATSRAGTKKRLADAIEDLRGRTPQSPAMLPFVPYPAEEIKAAHERLLPQIPKTGVQGV